MQREARADSDVRLVMLIDGTNVLTILTGGSEKASLSQSFKGQISTLSKVAPDFADSPVKNQDLRLDSGQRLKIRHSCAALPTKIRICSLAGLQAKSGLSISSTYVEGERSIFEMIKSIRLLTK